MPSERMKFVIKLVITVFVASYLIPQAINAILYTSTNGWNPAVATVFSVLLPIIVIVSIVLAIMPEDLKSRVGL